MMVPSQRLSTFGLKFVPSGFCTAFVTNLHEIKGTAELLFFACLTMHTTKHVYSFIENQVPHGGVIRLRHGIQSYDFSVVGYSYCLVSITILSKPIAF